MPGVGEAFYVEREKKKLIKPINKRARSRPARLEKQRNEPRPFKVSQLLHAKYEELRLNSERIQKSANKPTKTSTGRYTQLQESLGSTLPQSQIPSTAHKTDREKLLFNSYDKSSDFRTTALTPVRFPKSPSTKDKDISFTHLMESLQFKFKNERIDMTKLQLKSLLNKSIKNNQSKNSNKDIQIHNVMLKDPITPLFGKILTDMQNSRILVRLRSSMF